MKRFEYYKITDCTTETLNELGKLGWELVTITNNTYCNLYCFKRELVDIPVSMEAKAIEPEIFRFEPMMIAN